MNTPPCVYIAGSYSSDPAGNTRRAMDLANHLLDLGYAVECPHLSHYLHLRAERPYEEWLAHGLAKLKRCDVLLWDQGWIPGPSPGAQKELIEAEVADMGVCWTVADLCEQYPAS